ncbi:MAG: hypothetical protein ACKOWJ_04350 [Micrococcales bacterium]
MDIAFLVFYAALLGLVSPYVGLKDERYGILVPAGFAAVVGGVLWAGLIWTGLNDKNALLWIIVMLAMPLAGWVGTNQLARLRSSK